MWIVTTEGFYSAVAHRKHHDRLLVRARSAEDLRRLAEVIRRSGNSKFKGKVIETPLADYPVRMVVTRADFEGAVDCMTAEIAYDNFKSAVAKANHVRAHTYHGVWAALRRIETETSDHQKWLESGVDFDPYEEYDEDEYDDGIDHREDDADLDHVLRTQGPIGGDV